MLGLPVNEMDLLDRHFANLASLICGLFGVKNSVNDFLIFNDDKPEINLQDLVDRQ
jgi:hypothetical protein